MAEGGKKNYFYRLFVQKSVWSRTLNLCEIKILLKLVLSMFLCSESRKIYHWKAKLCGQIRIAGAIARVLSSSIFSWKRCIEGAFYRRIYTRKNVVSTSEHETIFLFSTRSIFKQLLIYFWWVAVERGKFSSMFKSDFWHREIKNIFIIVDKPTVWCLVGEHPQEFNSTFVALRVSQIIHPLVFLIPIPRWKKIPFDLTTTWFKLKLARRPRISAGNSRLPGRQIQREIHNFVWIILSWIRINYFANNFSTLQLETPTVVPWVEIISLI